MESSLDILEKAVQYVENQQHESPKAKTFCDAYVTAKSRHSSRPNTPSKSSPEILTKDDGNMENEDEHPQPVPVISPDESLSLQDHHVQGDTRQIADQDEQPKSKSNKSTRIHNVTDQSSSEAPSVSQNNHHHRNGIPSHLYADSKRSYSHRSANLPGISPPGRRSSFSHSIADSDQNPQGVAFPKAQLESQSASVAQPAAGAPTINPMMPFVHPLAYQALDPALYANVVAHQRSGKTNGEAVPQTRSPGSSPKSGLSGNLQNQDLSHLTYNLNNPALLMGYRGALASGTGFADVPLVFPPQLAAYGQAANVLPELASYHSLSGSEREAKRMLESMALPLAPQFLASPYFKSPGQPVLDSPNMQDKTVPKPRLSTDVGLATGVSPYAVNYLLNYQEALNNELLKLSGATSSPYVPSRSSVSPESTPKVPTSSRHTFSDSFRPPYGNSCVTTRSKSPVLERKSATPTLKSLQNGLSNYEPRLETSQPREIEASYPGNNDRHLDVNDTARRLTTAIQCNNGWEDHRRMSRERSPLVHSSLTEKSTKKRSHEQVGIPRDLIPDAKIHSQRSHASISGTSFPRSFPQGAKSNSPGDPLAQQYAAANMFAALTGKSGLGLSEKDSVGYLASANPYLFHPAATGLPTLPVSPYLRLGESRFLGATNNSASDAIAASTLAATSLLRPPMSAEALSEYTRLAAVAPYMSLLSQQQQQALSVAGMGSGSSLSQNYAAEALKQAALQQSLLESREKEQLPSPPHPALASVRPLFSNVVPPEASRSSPNLNHQKTILRHSAPHHLNSSSTHTSTSRSWTPPKYQDADANIKRELSPSEKRGLSILSNATHRTSSAPVTSRPIGSKSNNLKRRAEDDDKERFFKGADIKRRREVTTDTDVPDVDEHFRRSLKGNYKESDAGQSKVSITGSVDDHFKKALGKELWFKMKPSSSPDSPGSSEMNDLARDAMARTTASRLHSSHPPLNSSDFTASSESKHGSSLTSYPDPLKMFAGNALLKAREIVFPESVSKIPLTTGSSAFLSKWDRNNVMTAPQGRCVVSSSFSLGSKKDADFKQKSPPLKSRQSMSPSKESQRKEPPLNTPPHSTSPPLPSEKSYGLNLSNFVKSHSSLTPGPPLHGSCLNDDGSCSSSSSGPPPTYSPHSSTSASSPTPNASLHQMAVEEKACGDHSKVAAMPVQT